MLSIVIPVKNEAEVLPRLLRTIRQQTVAPKEVIVADAGSDDGTRDIARSLGCVVVEGGLPGPGRNRGAKVATGDIILFLDADVELQDVDFLEKSLAEMEARKLDITTARIAPISSKRLDRISHELYNIAIRLVAPFDPNAPGFCIFVRRRIHEAINGFDESVVFCEDHDYARRAARVGKLGYLRSTRIFVSVRRLERDGLMRTTLKYLLAELHIVFLGPIRSNIFNYTFGHRPRL